MIKNKNYVLAFFIPLVICLIFIGLKNVFYNIDSFMVSDLKVQLLAFLNYFKNVLLGKASMLYSFNAGMGSSMLSTIIFYCISPINLLLLFFKDTRYAILFIYLIKVSLAGLTMFILLKNKYERDSFGVVIFSICYALSSFVINYYFAIFWLDSLYLAPLVTLGIEKIFKTEKINLIYILSLSLAIICNIQMGFGLCVYSVIYYLYSFNIRYEIRKDFDKFKRLGIIFIISSLCAGAISSGIILGFISDLGSIFGARNMTITTGSGVSNIGYILKNLFTVGNLKSDYLNDTEPYIYCGLIVTYFSILYLFDKNIDKNKRKHSLIVIIIFILSFCIKYLNIFWHLSVPVMLNFRYSLYLGLFLTMIGYECYINKDRLIGKDITVLVCSLLLGLLMVMAYNKETYVIYTFIFLVLIFALIIISKNKNQKFEIVLLILVLVEVGFNGYLSILTDSNPKLAYKDFEKFSNKVSVDKTYRVLYDYSYTEFCSDTLLLDKYSSLRYFSSIIPGNLLNFYNRNLASVGNNNYLVSAYDSPLLLSLLGNKYFYLTEEFNNNIYQKIDEFKIGNDKIYLYENPYALSIGYMIDSDAKYEDGMNLVDYQNEIIKSFSGIDDDVTIMLEYETDDDAKACEGNTYEGCRVYNIKNSTKNPYVLLYGSLIDRISTQDGTSYYFDTPRPLLLHSLDSVISVLIQSYTDLDQDLIFSTTYNQNTLTESLEKLQDNMLQDVKFDKNIMTGKIDAEKDGILFLSIPYDDKFEISVDGKTVKYYSLLNDTFIGLDITKGEHNIELKYKNNSWILYLLSSVAALGITMILYLIINKKIDKRQKEEEIIRNEILEKKKKNTNNKKNKNKKKK